MKPVTHKQGPSRTGMTMARWKYLKALRPGFGQYLHVSRGLVPVNGADGIVRLAPWPKGHGKTYNAGRNKAKREARALKQERGF